MGEFDKDICHSVNSVADSGNFLEASALRKTNSLEASALRKTKILRAYMEPKTIRKVKKG